MNKSLQDRKVKPCLLLKEKKLLLLYKNINSDYSNYMSVQATSL